MACTNHDRFLFPSLFLTTMALFLTALYDHPKAILIATQNDGTALMREISTQHVSALV